MKKKILLIGTKSYLAKNLKIFLDKKYEVDHIEFKNYKKYLKKKYLFLINCSLSTKYATQLYATKNDRDLILFNKFKNKFKKYIFLSTSKVYQYKKNILSEKSPCMPKSIYGKNKLLTEKKLLKNSLNNNCLILRVSNIAGFDYNKKKIKTFFYNLLKNLKQKNIVYVPYKKVHKDFLSIDDFCQILSKCMKYNLSGIYNLSSGSGYDLELIAKHIISGYGSGKIIKKELFTDSFILSNKKLKKKIYFNINKKKFYNFLKLIGKRLKKEND